MQTVRDYGALSALISSQFRPGVLTNRILGAEELRGEIARGTLSVYSWAGGLFLLRRRPGHAVLHYYLTDLEALPEAGLPANTLVELPHRPQRADAAQAYFTRLGFAVRLRRIRLARPALEAQDEPAAAPAEEDARALYWLLTESFDPLTGCLPVWEEFVQDLRAGCVLTHGADALLRFLPGRTAEIRQLAVSPARRGQGLARTLVGRFNSVTAACRATVWTGADNAAAQHVYQAEGFAPDGWTSTVMIR
nr:GNAT family N-acetyltransferase [uncultured Agathobaculum sp.]